LSARCIPPSPVGASVPQCCCGPITPGCKRLRTTR
jgi:hypothetical protein